MALNLGSALLSITMALKSDHASVVPITLFVALLSACIVIGHLMEENRWMNESITALFFGLISGVGILLTTKGKSSHILVFSEDLFFIYLLPPIIFNAGVNYGTTLLHAFYATQIMIVGAIGIFEKLNIGSLDIGDYLAIGAIFSATDSVCTLQGVVNDATSVVLFNAIQKFDLVHMDAVMVLHLIGNFFYLFATSTFLGAAAGLLSAYIIKKLYFGRHSTDREVSLMMLMAYLSYMLAELLDLSGILTVFFCGIVMSHYTWHNVTESSRITTKHAFATLSFISVTFLFLYVGMDALDIEKWKFVTDSPTKSVGLSTVLIGLVLVGRAAFVFPLSFLSNLPKKSPEEKISIRQQVIIWWAGLMRGAVSIALAYNQFTRAGHTQLRGNAFMITSTITVVLFSTVVFGLLTKPLIRLLLPPCPKYLSSMSLDPPSPKSFLCRLLEQGPQDEAGGVNIVRPTSLRMLLTKPSKSVHHYWRKFDDAFMRPIFGGRGFVPFVPGSPTERDNPPDTSTHVW